MRKETIAIRRNPESLDGKIISYLKTDPLHEEKDFSELVTSTLKAHWLPLALFDEGLRGEKMRQIGIRAIAKLEAQISVIRRICGLDADPVRATPVVINQTFGTSGDTASIWREISDNHSNNNSQSNAQAHEDDDEDDDWELMKMPKTAEMEEINKIFGV
ncbi:hypothetical protein IQ243_25790 [Nostocales cyanobacterium LEGE 11386]|nr:hypothetical protein [Nostocales cyanobacterium LEGE 11386]